MESWMIVYIVATLLILPSVIWGAICQSRAVSVFDRYSKVAPSNGITASELTKKLLENANINDVDVVKINGKLTDCYDPRHKVIKLSSSTYDSSSMSALGVCAHEVGHAIQDNKKMFLFRLRLFLVPIVNFINRLFIPLVLVGSLLSFAFYLPYIGEIIIWISVALYGASLLFYLVTLPLERDASKRALKILDETELFTNDELSVSKNVLTAAIYTYISALVTTTLYFLRFLSYALIFAKNKD